MNNDIRYSEIFFSAQGEGLHTGTPAVWLRFAGCNLNCNGFGQKDPTNPSTYVLPYKNIDLSDVTTITDLPVFEYGCDSSYSWSNRYQHLMKRASSDEVIETFQKLLKSNFGSDDFTHGTTGTKAKVVFTGGEPFIQQNQIINLLSGMIDKKSWPDHVIFETNGTIKLKNDLLKSMRDYFTTISVSPKLFSVSGEKDALDVDVVNQYSKYADEISLKFVVDGSASAWNEAEQFINKIKINSKMSLWAMPVGATKEQQERPDIGAIADEAMRRGYNVAARVHTYLWGNKIGK